MRFRLAGEEMNAAVEPDRLGRPASSREFRQAGEKPRIDKGEDDLVGENSWMPVVNMTAAANQIVGDRAVDPGIERRQMDRDALIAEQVDQIVHLRPGAMAL